MIGKRPRAHKDAPRGDGRGRRRADSGSCDYTADAFVATQVTCQRMGQLEHKVQALKLSEPAIGAQLRAQYVEQHDTELVEIVYPAGGPVHQKHEREEAECQKDVIEEGFQVHEGWRPA